MIIGISGKKQSGKDLVGRIIQYIIWKDKVEKGYMPLGNYCQKDFFENNYDLQGALSGWKIKKFADKLKDMVCMLIGCTREQLEDETFKNTELGEEWWYFKGRNGSLISYNEDSKRSDEDLIKPTPRLLMQLIGTECGREILHPNIWVNSLMSEYKDQRWISKAEWDVAHGLPYNPENDIPLYPNWIITDIRFPNEAQAIKDRGGITIRVERFTSIKNDLVYFKNDSDDSPINGIYRILEVKKDNCTLIDDKTGYSFGAWFEEISKINEHESETALDDYKFDYYIDNNGTIEELIEKVKEILIKQQIIK